MNTVIQTKNLSKSYGKTQVLKNINLTIEQGEFTAVMGPSGSGKTTLMNTLSTIDSFNSGDVSIEGKSLLDMKKRPYETSVKNEWDLFFMIITYWIP